MAESKSLRKSNLAPAAGPFAADRLIVEVSTPEPRTVEVDYVVDARPEATIRVQYPEVVADLPPEAVDLIAAASAIYLGSLALAAEVEIARPLSPGLVEDMGRIVEMLYDIRRWKDDRPLGPPAQLLSPARDSTEANQTPLTPRKSALLWSGGKDSTLSLVTLRANEYDICPVHVTINSGVEELERRAVVALSAWLGAPTETVTIEHPDFGEFTRAYAREWDRFPHWNRVPFGRDLLTAAVAVPFALASGASFVSMGHDNECRTAIVHHRGKRIPRNDLESAEGATILERAIRTYVHPDLGLLPPVGNLSELRILRDMFARYGELMELASFCFWGDKCGRCAKCLRYYLADQVYGGGQLRFQANPLTPGACPELDDLLHPEPRSTLFQKEVLLLLGRLTEARSSGPDEGELDRFRRTHYQLVEPHLDEWEDELLAPRSDPQVPHDFRPAYVEAVRVTE
jgi:7-cyano-7-deazaguanine synthase in queuosine biosynthesis